jgi:hypothetical protein
MSFETSEEYVAYLRVKVEGMEAQLHLLRVKNTVLAVLCALLAAISLADALMELYR